MSDQSSQLAIASADSMVPTTMQQAIEFSTLMAKGNLIPAHLKNPADCLRVVLQASKWQFDPFAVADKTSVINGKLMYEGQLVMAVINARGKMKERLSYDYKGEGDARVLTVSGTIKGEDEARTIELPFTLAKKINRNGQMAINPDQQAAYIGARLWARKHMPELMLGVYTPDETDPGEPVNVTPGATGGREEAPAKESGSSATVAANPSGSPASTDEKRGRGRPRKDAAQPPIEAVTTPVDDKKPEPAAEPEKHTALKDGQKVTVQVRVQSLKAEAVTLGGKVHPAVIAMVEGGFTGRVYHLDGAMLENEKYTPKAPWAAEANLTLHLIGKARRDPALPCSIFVEAAHAAEAPATDDLG